jgi:hypothetical protein
MPSSSFGVKLCLMNRLKYSITKKIVKTCPLQDIKIYYMKIKDVMAYRCFNLFVCWYTSMELFSRLRFYLTLRRIVLWWHFLRLYFRGSLYFVKAVI